MPSLTVSPLARCASEAHRSASANMRVHASFEGGAMPAKPLSSPRGARTVARMVMQRQLIQPQHLTV